MFSTSFIHAIVEKIITKSEMINKTSGGSKHLSQKTFKIEEISPLLPATHNKLNGWLLSFMYSITVETEFTYYPDNPPYEYKYLKKVLISDKGAILHEFPKEGGMKNRSIDDWSNFTFD
jgi:hypothetical protein